jgi:hypothetical protein
MAVADHCAKIASHYPVDARSGYILLSAAYFHDTGHLYGFMDGHEKAGVDIMRNYFENCDIEEEMLMDIERCILATKWPVKPKGLLEEIICDADTFHLGTDDFPEMDKKVWDEIEMRTGKPVTNRAEKSLQFLLDHQFHTEYCQKLLNEGKAENLEWLRTKIRKK